MYSGITSGRVLNGELLYTKILEVNLFAFAYRLFRRDFSPLDGHTAIYISKGLQCALTAITIVDIYIYIYIYIKVKFTLKVEKKF